MAARPKPKVSKIFRLDPALVAKLEKEAQRTKRTQTFLLQAALQEYLSVKR